MTTLEIQSQSVHCMSKTVLPALLKDERFKTKALLNGFFVVNSFFAMTSSFTSIRRDNKEQMNAIRYR